MLDSLSANKHFNSHCWRRFNGDSLSLTGGISLWDSGISGRIGSQIFDDDPYQEEVCFFTAKALAFADFDIVSIK